MLQHSDDAPDFEDYQRLSRSHRKGLNAPTRRGDPIDFGKPRERPRREANPLIWGAWGGIVGAAIGTIAGLAGQLEPSQTVIGFGAGGFFWMEIVARIWNRLGRRKAY